MNPHYMYPRQRLFAAVQSLMVPVVSENAAIAGAMREVTLALKDVTLPPEADRHYLRIMAFMNGPGPWQQRAERLVRGQRAELSLAVLELFCAVDLLYHKTTSSTVVILQDPPTNATG